MLTKITLFITLLAYSFIVSQSFMYILSLKNVQMSLGADAYTQIRKLTDIAMRDNFKYVIYAALIANLVLLFLHRKEPGSIVFIVAAIAFIALVADILLTLKGSLPVNDVINTWSPGNYPDNWTAIRDKWFNIFQYRQVANITGFISLLAGVVFRAR